MELVILLDSVFSFVFSLFFGGWGEQGGIVFVFFCVFKLILYTYKEHVFVYQMF